MCVGVVAQGWLPAPGPLTSFTAKSIKVSPPSPVFSVCVSDQREA